MPGTWMIRRWWQCLWKEGNQKSSWRSSWGQGRFLVLGEPAATGKTAAGPARGCVVQSLGSDALVLTGWVCILRLLSLWLLWGHLHSDNQSITGSHSHPQTPPNCFLESLRVLIRGPSPATQVNLTQSPGRNFIGFCLVPLKLWTFTESLLNARYS